MILFRKSIRRATYVRSDSKNAEHTPARAYALEECNYGELSARNECTFLSQRNTLYIFVSVFYNHIRLELSGNCFHSANESGHQF